MNVERFKRILQAKEKDLIAEIARLEQEAREAQVAEVEDAIDRVNTDEVRAASLGESTAQYALLRQVRDALQRIEDGTYGICVDCGRPIPEARLEAVPWTLYCREDQEKHDRERPEPDVFEAAEE